jgi:NADPH-ferrihemoprotein reductase
MDWKEDILQPLSTCISLEERPVQYVPSIDLIDTSVDQNLVYLGERSEKELYGVERKAAYNARNPYAAPVAASKVLEAAPDRVCVHMEFNLSAVPALRYQTGDHLAVWTPNPVTEVDRLLRILDIDEEQRKRPITVEIREGSQNNITLPSPTTRESLIKYYLEICAVISRDLLLLLSQYAPSEDARNALIRLGKDKDAFRNEIVSGYLNVGKVMEIYGRGAKWNRVPFTLLLESFGRIQPRRYSISSSPLIQPRQPAITMVVNNHLIKAAGIEEQRDRFYGVATNFLLAHNNHHDSHSTTGRQVIQDIPAYDLDGPRGKLASGKVYIHIQRSTFKLPLSPATPIIMVGAGTGIAPFRGFVQERTRLAELGNPIGKMVLFYGCRNDTTDFLYCSEWESFQAKLGERFTLIPAFSRQAGQNKKYVQDALAESRDLVSQLVLEDGAAFYICGAASMAREVRARLVEILAEKTGQGFEDADTMVAGKMKRAGLYHEDVWS